MEMVESLLALINHKNRITKVSEKILSGTDKYLIKTYTHQ